MDLKKEAEYFGDIVIVPYMDHYDLVVLKTVAICEYGVIKLTNFFVSLLFFLLLITFLISYPGNCRLAQLRQSI